MRIPHYKKSLCLVALFAAQAAVADEQPHTLQTLTTYSSSIADRFDAHLQNPSSSTYISGQAIEDVHASNIEEILRGVPGVTADLSGHGDEVKIKIRGIESQRFFGENPGVAIVIDGVPVFERTGKVNIDLDNIESIRVIKGGASYLYGADALAGAVIITTKGGEQKNRVGAEYELGSFGDKKELLMASFAHAGVSGRLQYARRETDGYHYLSTRNSDTYFVNLEWAATDAMRFKFNYEDIKRFRDGSGSISGVTQARLDPQGRNASRGYTRNTDADLQRINLSYSHDFSLTGNLSLIGYQFKDTTSYWQTPVRFDGLGRPVPDSNYSAYASAVNYRQTQRGAKLELKETWGELAMLGGLDFREDHFADRAVARQDYKNSPSPFAPVIRQGTVGRQGTRSERTRAAYAELKYGLTPLTTVTGNYRFDLIKLADSNRLTGQKRDDRFRVPSWRLGIDHGLAGNTSVYAGVSTGFRAPTLAELSTNNRLKPEHTHNYEIGLRTEQPILGWDTSINASIFHLRRKDFITSVAGQSVNAQAVGEEKYDNIGDVLSQGLELALSTGVRHALAFDVAYTYLDSHYKKYDNFYLAHGNPRGTAVGSLGALTDPNSQVYFMHYNNKKNQVPRTSRHRLNFRTHWDLHETLRLTLESDYRSSSYADEINQEKIKARNVLGLTLNYRNNLPILGRESGSISGFVKVENLANKRFYTTARGIADSASISGNYDGVYNAEDLSIVVNPGRTWSAGIAVRF